MYLSAERLALANEQVRETFEQTSIAWQSIPRWDTADPGQTYVRTDLTNATAVAPPNVEPPLGVEMVAITGQVVRFAMSLAQAMAPSPDALLAAVIARTEHLAQAVDDDVVDKLTAKVPVPGFVKTKSAENVLAGLIDARMVVEDAGYLAPCCLFADRLAFKILSSLIDGVPATEYLSPVPNINSFRRFRKLDQSGGGANARLLLLGRRQLIADGRAADASPGEEPADLAVSIPPSLECVGDNGTGLIEWAVRIRYALRIKDVSGLVAVVVP
ncbi:hypothetical protein [Mycobacterium sp. ITM-2016-00318]|uniref:hypothetical protein n=1 Tax=Mycobacterium sp. ITM-2016-00318 TaxID=2099693 RepID=UPI000CF9B5C9|nr:hypothetical protein [Mycobacterium sp. ITM-2016-00318]WNG93957.1 hypothetical protein C6A82_005750 [Mycobacterium sp. ITM-2016-00318]